MSLWNEPEFFNEDSGHKIIQVALLRSGIEPNPGPDMEVQVIPSELQDVRPWWEVVQENLKVVIPVHLKNLLHFCGFDNAIALAELTDASIEKLEKTAREELPDIIDLESQGEEFFGKFYKKNPKRFTIGEGHKILLKKIAHFLNQRCVNHERVLPRTSGTADCTSEKEKMLQPPAPTHSDGRTPDSSTPISTPKALVPATDLQKEELALIKVITDWSKKNKYFISREFFEKVEKMKVVVRVKKEGDLQAEVTCPLCGKKKAFTKGKTWVSSNFNAHLKNFHFQRLWREEDRLNNSLESPNDSFTGDLPPGRSGLFPHVDVDNPEDVVNQEDLVPEVTIHENNVETTAQEESSPRKKRCLEQNDEKPPSVAATSSASTSFF